LTIDWKSGADIMKRLILLATLCCLLVLAAGGSYARDVALEKEMATLEKAYIKPLFYSNKENLSLTMSTMEGFKSLWQGFSATYRSHGSPPGTWLKHFEDIDSAIARADAGLATKNVAVLKTSVHPALEEVRDSMALLRSQNGFPCFTTDRMSTFHEQMERMTLPLQGTPPDQVTREMIAALKAVHQSAAAAWTEVESCPVEAAIWGFDETDMAALKGLFAAERKALTEFGKALESENRPGIKASGMAVRQNFAKAYVRFAGIIIP
jgi:hypothetical protein